MMQNIALETYPNTKCPTMLQVGEMQREVADEKFNVVREDIQESNVDKILPTFEGFSMRICCFFSFKKFVK